MGILSKTQSGPVLANNQTSYEHIKTVSLNIDSVVSLADQLDAFVELEENVSADVIIATAKANDAAASAILAQQIADSLNLITWFEYLIHSKYEDVLVTLASGIVRTYLHSGTGNQIYRYITSEFTDGYPTEDSFYSTFDGTTLSNLLAAR